ncbi:DUF1471 family virulence protein SrfN [Salmonella enterica]
MKKCIIAAALLATVASFSTLAAEQVSKQEISHFKLVKVGTINVSQSGGQISSPTDLREKLSALADAKGGKYYHIIAARECSGSQKARMRSKKDATPCCVAF